MLTLFVKTGCPFSAKVREAAAGMGIALHEQNIADEGVRDAFLAAGGIDKTPYLVDDERGVSMGESDDIILYLKEHYENA